MNTVTLHFKADNQQLTALDGLYKLASNTVEYVKAIFTLGENWAGFDVVRAAWYTDFECISTVLDGNGECFVPWEVLSRPEGVTINLYGCDLEEESDGEAVLVDRLTTYPVKAILVDVDARVCGSETKPVTPSQFEQYIAIVEQIVGTVKDIDHTELTDDYCLIIYYSDGTNSGKLGPIRGATGATGNGIVSAVLNADYTLTLTYDNGDSDTVGPIRGAQGETGNGIQSVYLTGTHGAVKTYTILFTDGTTTTFDVTDGEVTLAQLSAVLPTDTASGAIASFPDGSDLFDYLSCIVDISPVQDLHGYDKPWVGGAGVNRLESVSGTSNGITFTPNADGTINLNGTFINNAWTQIITTHTLSEMGLSVGDTTTIYSDLHIGIESYDENDARINFSTAVNQFKTYTIPSGTVYVNILFYADTTASGIAGTSINGNYKYLVAKGSVNTWTPYSNICPISGRSSVGVTGCGKNIFDEDTVFVTTLGGVKQADGSYYFSNPNAIYNQVVWTNITGHSGSLALTLIRKTTANKDSIRFNVYYTDGTSQKIGNSNGTGGFDTYTLVTNSSKTVDRIVGDYGSNEPNYINFQIELGSTATTYEPYNGHTYTIPLGQTVYGGTLNTADGSLDIAPYFASYNGETLVGEWISDRDKYVEGTTPTIGAQVVNIGGVTTETSIAPVPITPLLGQNNIFSDSGDTDVTYKADTQLWVEKKLGA